MKAIGISGGKSIKDPNLFIEFNTEAPKPGPHDLLVKIEAVSVNPIDTKIRNSIEKLLAQPQMLGWDASGTIEQTGKYVTLFKPEDKVFYAGDITRSGSNAKYQLVDERIAGHHPQNLNFAEAAAIPLTALTAWEALFERLAIDPKKDKGKNILIIGGAGGVGSIAIQLAKKVAGLKVTATASRTASQSWCKLMGADQCLNHFEDLFIQYEESRMDHPDFILCLNDTDMHFNIMANLIAPQGTICSIVGTTKDHNLEILKSKSAGFVWEFMFTRSMFKTEDMIKQHEILNKVSHLLDKRILQSTLTENLGKITPDNLQLAHQKIESGRTIGKIVLEGFE